MRKQKSEIIVQFEPDSNFKFEEFIGSVLDWPEPKEEDKEICRQKKK